MSNESPLVLVAEDESLVRDLIEAVLEESGFALRLACSGREAMNALDALKVAALVTDIDLGAGCSGWEVAVHAGERNPSVPVIYMSGASAYRGVPNSQMLAKPFVPTLLLAVLQTELGAPGRAGR